MEQRTVNLELRDSNFEERIITGYAAIFNDEYTLLRDRWGEKFYEKVSKGAFLRTLADNTRDKFMLVNHDWNKVIGRTGSNLKLEEDEKGLRFELTVPNTTEGNNLLENVRLGLIKGCSFGFSIIKEKTRWDDDWNFYRDITEVDLFEVTATPIPAYADTEISARSELNINVLRKEVQPKLKENNEPEKADMKRNAKLVFNFLSAFNNENNK